MTQVEQHQLDSLLDVESGLTEWELEFIENMDANWRHRELSEKQSETLEKIYDRRVS